MGKMQKGNVVKGKQSSGHKLIIYAPEGVGKSTFAAGAPNPIFLDVEDGTSRLDVDRYPHPNNWEECAEAIDDFCNDPGDYKTLVIDTIDVMERMLHEHILTKHGKKSMNEFDYGGGYVMSKEILARKFDLMKEVAKTKNVNFIVLGHCKTKMKHDPQGHDHDRYILNINDGVSTNIKGWADAVGFANYETQVSKDPTTGKVKVVDTGNRCLYFQRHRGYDAKNRFDLPKRIDLSWDAYASRADNYVAGKTNNIEAKIDELLSKLADEKKKTIVPKINKMKKDGDTEKLKKAYTHLLEMVEKN